MLVLIRANIPHKPHYPDIPLQLLEVALFVIGQQVLLLKLLFPFFVLYALLAALVQFRTNAVLRIVEDGFEVSSDTQFLSLFLKADELLVQGDFVFLRMHVKVVKLAINTR